MGENPSGRSGAAGSPSGLPNSSVVSTESNGQDLVYEIKKGIDAEAWLDDEEAVAEWQQLYCECPSATPFLSPIFAATWIRHYRDAWTLVLVIARDVRGIRGVMPLALQGLLITGVGAHQAEYQGWLSRPEDDPSFLDDALKALFHTFPKHQLRLRYVLAGSGADAVHALARTRVSVFLSSRSRPLMKLDPGVIDTALRKKSNKSKYNRLKQHGDIVFEHITDPDEFARIFDSIITLYDFRQGAANNSCPFISDPHKKAFHLDWFREAREQLQVTCLRLNGQVIAALIGVHSGTGIAVAIVAFSAEYARHSPGKIHIYHTARLLAEQGQGYLDLTPGGDAWKERFSTEHAPVLELVVYARASDARRASCLAAIEWAGRRALVTAGIRPAWVKSYLQRLRRLNAAKIATRVRRLRPNRVEYRVYRFDLCKHLPISSQVNAQVNALEDLVRFTPVQPWQRRQHFLSRALARIESGGRSYTIRDGNTLLHYGWIADYQEKSFFSEVSQTYRYPESGAVLYEFFTAPSARNRGYYQNTIVQMLTDLKQRKTASVAYIAVLADNHPSRHVIEKMGFEHVSSLYCSRVLWHKEKWQQEGGYETGRLQENTEDSPAQD